MRFFCALSCVVLAVAVVAPVHSAVETADPAARTQFQEAYARVFAHPDEPAVEDSELLRSYVLYSYLEAARIRHALDSGADLPELDARAARFIAAHKHLPVARTLRHAWLESLARRSHWTAFLASYEDETASETARCQSFTARIVLERTKGLAAAIVRQWLTPRSLPECDPAFAWLRETGALTSDLIEERARLALETDNPSFAREISAQLPKDRAAPLLQWASLLESPEPRIDALIAAPHTGVETAALLAGWTRLARAHPEAAKERYARLIEARGLPPESASRFALALALALARDRDPDALEYFERVPQSELDDTSLAWRARAALWSKAWDEAAESIAALSESAGQTARWRYWAARITEAQHDADRARPMYESLLADDTYYSVMAAARLNRSITPHPNAIQVDPELMASIERLPALERARELFLCGMRREATAEWRYGYETLSPEERLQSIPLAASWGWYDQAVAAATAQHVFNDYVLLYPRPFIPQVQAAAQLTHLEPDLIYAIVRQESLYRNDAVSRAGARGLMQLMPQSALTTARYWKLPKPALADLFDPSVNISLGAAHLRMLLDQFDDQLPVALAGYNAGVKAAVRWLPPTPLDTDIWIENIPYEETREYVEHVLWHSVLLRWLRSDGEAQSAESWLTHIRSLHDAQPATRMVEGSQPP